MTPIEEYILELVKTYALYVLTWTYDNLVILYYYLSSLATIVLLEYLFLFFTGKKKTEIILCLCKVWKFIFLGRARTNELTKKMARRFKREDRIVEDFIAELRRRNHASLIARVNFFLIEIKALFIRKFVQIMDGLFFLIAYLYVYVKFHGNMRVARLNPDVNTMLQRDEL